MRIIIREAQEKELPETAEIYIECLRNDYSYKPAECLDWLEEEPAYNKIFVAVDGCRVAGYISTGRNSCEPLEYEGEITGFFVRREYRRQGIGMRLLRRAVEFLQEQGWERFVLYNYRRSEANRYYRNLGGRVLGEEIQEPGGMALTTDIFGFDMGQLLERLDKKLAGYRLEKKDDN